LKSSLVKFALACATSSLLAQTTPAARPAIALLDAADAAQWEAWTKEPGWRIILPKTTEQNLDLRVQALDTAVAAAIKEGSVDAARVYLAGRGSATAEVFYTISRVPDLWAAAVAVGGSPQPAINTDRIFGSNFSNVSVLWISSGGSDEAVAQKLRNAGVPLEWRRSDRVAPTAVFEWLMGHTRAEYPADIDCETSSPTFSRCYWLTVTKFDSNERNEVLASSRIDPGSQAALDLGGFGFPTDDPGPGLRVTFLPEKYAGPLKMGDRIVALDGRPVTGPRQYLELMAQVTEERPANVMVERGKDRIRLETHIVFPRRAPVVTGRVQARYAPEEKEIQIISRAVVGMRVMVPAAWTPALLSWNGVALEKVQGPGCRLLTIEKSLENIKPCD
jgi:hypothetical protein